MGDADEGGNQNGDEARMGRNWRTESLAPHPKRNWF